MPGPLSSSLHMSQRQLQCDTVRTARYLSEKKGLMLRSPLPIAFSPWEMRTKNKWMGSFE